MSPESIDWMRNLSLIFLSLFIQGLPFLLFGAVLGSVVITQTPIRKWLLKIPRSPLPAAFLGAFAGFLIPSCECFAIPLVRRLKSQGLPTAAAMAYLLSAPTLNPLCLISTWSAFYNTGHPYAVLARIAGSLIMAVCIGYIFSKIPDRHLWSGDLLREISPRQITPRYSWKDTFLMTLADFQTIAIYYIIGCFIAAILQNTSFLPLLSVNMPMGDSVLMMVFAFISCICSSADAFIASSLSSITLPAKMAFLWLGPVLNLKLVFAYPMLLKIKPLLFLSLAILILVITLSTILGKVPLSL